MKPPGAPASPPASRTPPWARAAAAALLALHVGLGLAFIRSAAPTYDEAVHLASGYSYLATGRYRLNIMDHPPLAEMWAALPLIPLRPHLFLSHPDWERGRLYHYSDYFLNHNKRPGESLLNAGRVFSFLTWAALLAWALWAWGRRWGGWEGGLGALAAFALCPPLIAHLALVSTDGASTAFFFLVFWLLSGERRGPGRWVWAGLCAGLALASKFNMILLAPLVLLPLLWESRGAGMSRRFPWGGCLMASAAALLALAAVYRFHAFPLYWRGLAATLHRLEQGRSSFLMGNYSDTGFWAYFPVALAVKTPAPLLLFSLGGLALWAARWRERVWAWAPALGYLAAAIPSKVQIGLRHALPVYPFLALAAGCAGAWAWRRGAAGRAACAVAGLWLAASVLRASPHQLAYFNEIAGGPSRGHLWLADSNLDWGQDLKGLARYAEGQGGGALYLSYFGTADPEAYGLRYVPVACVGNVERRGSPDDPAASGRVLLAVSATNLQAVYFLDKNVFSWLKERRPARVFGHSLFLYDLSADAEGCLRLARLLEASGDPRRARSLSVLAASLRERG